MRVLLPPKSTGAFKLFELLLTIHKLLPGKVLIGQSILVFAMTLHFPESTNHVVRGALDLVKNLLLGLFILNFDFSDALGIHLAPLHKVLQHAQIKLFAHDRRDCRVVEECHFPVVLLEALREVLKAGLLKSRYVRLSYEAFYALFVLG